MIPTKVRDFLASLRRPSALVGCRAAGSSFPCCEHDVAVFGQGSNSVVQLGDDVIELIYVDRPVLEFADLEIINDSKSFSLSSKIKDVTQEKRLRSLRTWGRKALVTSLMYQQLMKDEKKPEHASMWLKAGAYQFVRGALAIAGERPMPAHELEQIRQSAGKGLSDGIEAALECIGVERATRPAISRSIGAVSELKIGDYDARLVQAKVEWMLEKRMLADCYYFLGRVACGSLMAKDTAFRSRYTKLIQLALDLSADQPGLGKLQKDLSRATKKALL